MFTMIMILNPWNSIGNYHLPILQVHHPDFVCLVTNEHFEDLRRSISSMNLNVTLISWHLVCLQAFTMWIIAQIVLRFQILHFKNFANDFPQKLCKLPISCVLSSLFLDCVRQVDGGSKSRHWLICHRMCACRHSLVNDCQPWNQILPMFSVIHEILECQEARNCSFKSWILTLPSNLFLILSTSFRVKQIACV